ncbi:hypothetical protein Tco_0713724 [Tanacetum coccineum]
MLGVYPASSHKIKINKEIPESVTTVLQEIEDVFALPTELPPQRTHDHKIPLVPNTSPINIRPHRHPSSQKDAIEVMRMCVDFRQLNNYTVKDKFPIPVIEELMDELGGSAVFSKLDLSFGYHQIRMNEEDIGKTAFRTYEGHYSGRSLCSSAISLTNNENNKLFAKQSKCSFAVKKVEYLGHVMSGEGEASEDDDGVLDKPSLQLRFKQRRFWFCMFNAAYPKYGYGVLKVHDGYGVSMSQCSQFLVNLVFIVKTKP